MNKITKIEILRRERGLTQAKASELAGMPLSSWCKAEKGYFSPTLRTLKKVAKALGVHIQEIIDE